MAFNIYKISISSEAAGNPAVVNFDISSYKSLSRWPPVAFGTNP
jgi:hypothetical protein